MNVHRLEERREDVALFRAEGIFDYGSLRSFLPVADLESIPVARGVFQMSAAFAKAPELVVGRTRTRIDTVGVSVLDPAYTGFAVLGPTSGHARINGSPVGPNHVCMPGSDNEFYLSGERRDALIVGVRRQPLIECLASLRGVDPEDIVLDTRLLEAPGQGGWKLHGRLASLLESAASYSPRELTAEVLGLLVEAYLHAHPDRSRRGGSGSGHDEQIVRRAEECFASAEGRPISLADLCRAAGVGKTGLYRAFHKVCGEPPLSYFRRRKLVAARSRLLSSPRERGAVKRAALAVGLTELGRFSVEYRRLFGESPSVTLSRTRTRTVF